MFAFLLGAAVAWIVIDQIFSPFGEASVSVEIPNLCGQQLEETELEDWIERRVEYRYDSARPAGEILSQSPVGGSRRKLSAQAPTCTLTLVVSLGEETVRVPSVVGIDHREAQATLREMGLSVELREVSGAYTPGTVISVEPRAGETIPAKSRVILTVSTGMTHKTVTVPNLIGLSRSDALVKLWLSELTVGNVIEETSDEDEGTVIRQSHRPGTYVLAGSEITLYVSREIEE